MRLGGSVNVNSGQYRIEQRKKNYTSRKKSMEQRGKSIDELPSGLLDQRFVDIEEPVTCAPKICLFFPLNTLL